MCPSQSKIAQEIQSYIEENPESNDTSEGIAKWWLEDKYLLSEVEEALSQLVEEGVITRRQGKNSQSVYKKR